MIQIAYKKGQKLKGLKTKRDAQKKLKIVRRSRVAYLGGKPGNYTITIGAAKKKPSKKAKKRPVRKKPVRRKSAKRKPVRRKVTKRKPTKRKPARKKPSRRKKR